MAEYRGAWAPLTHYYRDDTVEGQDGLASSLIEHISGAVYDPAHWNTLTAVAAAAGDAPATVTRDANGNITGYSDPSEVVTFIVRTASGVTTYTENGTIRTILRDSSGRITGVN